MPCPTQSGSCRITLCTCGSITEGEVEARNLPWHGGQRWVPHSILGTCTPDVSTELGSLTWDLGVQEAVHSVPVPVGAICAG